MQLWLICFIVPMLLAIYAQGLVKARYASASKRKAFDQSTGGNRPLTGGEVARRILDSAGLQHVPIEVINRGALNDYYDPTNRKICLSSEIYHGCSLADVGIAAHEAGHAIQHANNYLFLGLMQSAFPIARFGSQFAFLIFIVGIMLQMLELAWVGVGLFGFIAVYQIIDLPVEYNASNRAKAALANLGMVSEPDMVYVRKVLSAAALTYVAAMLASLMQFLYFALRLLGDRN